MTTKTIQKNGNNIILSFDGRQKPTETELQFAADYFSKNNQDFGYVNHPITYLTRLNANSETKLFFNSIKREKIILSAIERASERAAKYAHKHNPYSTDEQNSYDRAYADLYDSVYLDYLSQEENDSQ